MGEKKQLKLWLLEEKIAEVESVAAEWGYKNANAVIEQMIDDYLELFVAAEKARRDEVLRQKQFLLGVAPSQKRRAG